MTGDNFDAIDAVFDKLKIKTLEDIIKMGQTKKQTTPNRQSEWELDINTWFLENVGSASTKELAIKFDNLMIVVENILASHRQKLKGEVEKEKQIHKHDSIMAYHVAEAEEGCQWCIKNQTLDSVIKLLGE